MSSEYKPYLNGMMKRLYKPGVDRAAFIEEVMQQSSQPVDPERLNHPMAAFMQPYVIPEEQREQRRAESAQARRQMIELEMAQMGRPNITLVNPIGRSHDAVIYYFQQTGHPEELERFENLFRVRENPEVRAAALQEQGVPQQEAEERVKAEDRALAYERGHYIAEFMDRFREYTPERLLSMTPDDVQAHLMDVALLQGMSMNVEPHVKLGPDAGDDIAFSPADYEKSKYLLDAYPPSSYALTQFMAKVNPCYEMLDTAQLLSDITMESMPMYMAVQKSESTDFDNMCADMLGGCTNQHLAIQTIVMNALKEHGIDLKQPFTALSPEGRPLDLVGNNYTDFLDYWKDGGEIIAQQGNVRAQVSVKKINGQYQLVDKTAELIMKSDFNEGYAAGLTEIDADMKNADPWYIHSSSQFRTMKERYKELKALGGELSDDPAVREQQKAKLDELKKAADAYLGFKGTEGKNDLEKSRIALAQKIQNMATNKYDVLDRPEREARERAAEAEAKARDLPDINTFSRKLGEFHVLGVSASLRSAVDYDIRNRIQAGQMPLMDKMDANMDKLDQPIDRTAGSAEEHTLLWLTVKAMVANDEALRGKENGAPLVDALNKGLSLDKLAKVVRKTPSYQEKLANMTLKGMYDFVVKGEYKQLAQQVSKDCAVLTNQAKANEKEAPQMQNAPQQEQKKAQQGPQL